MTSTKGDAMNETGPRFPRSEELAAHLVGAETPALLMTTAHLTGAPEVLRPEWRPVPDGLPRGGLDLAREAAVREFCLARLAAHVASGHPAPIRPDRALLRAIAEWAIGPVSDQEVECLDDALVMDGKDPDAPDWTLPESGDGPAMRVAVIGAGVSGLLTGLRLKQAEIPFTIFEKSSEVGGTWYENTYPDCRVDVPSHIYTYSFVPYDWTSYFCRQDVVRQYLVAFAKEHDLLEHVQFGTEVTDATWDERSARWTITVQGAEGERAESFSAFVSAVGQLNRPSIPHISGRDTFRGPAFHSARWDHSVDLTGKRIDLPAHPPVAAADSRAARGHPGRRALADAAPARLPGLVPVHAVRAEAARATSGGGGRP
jgi:4-hydroxyacetophenone monooxygenase